MTAVPEVSMRFILISKKNPSLESLLCIMFFNSSFLKSKVNFVATTR